MQKNTISLKEILGMNQTARREAFIKLSAEDVLDIVNKFRAKTDSTEEKLFPIANWWEKICTFEE